MGSRRKRLGTAQKRLILRSMPASRPQSLSQPESDEFGPVSPFDRDEVADDELWFLPADETADPDAPPLPMPGTAPRALFDPSEWRRAQGDLGAELATLTLQFGILHERLGRLGEGIRHRLAIREAEDLSWWCGSRVSVERLTLWVGQRIGSGSDDGLAMAQAGWAVRRLSAGQGPGTPDWEQGIPRFLGRLQSGAGPNSHAVEELADVMVAAQSPHLVTQAAMLFHCWRLAGQAGARDLEAAVMAACHAAGMVRDSSQPAGAVFLPLAMGGITALRATGSAHARLAGWLSGAEQATRAALLHLERLAAWQRAGRDAARVGGRRRAGPGAGRQGGPAASGRAGAGGGRMGGGSDPLPGAQPARKRRRARGGRRTLPR